MNMLSKISLVFISLPMFSLDCLAQENLNLVGQKAPIIKAEEWIDPINPSNKWEELTLPDDLKGKVIVLDFWFTVCAPCVASIPHLNGLSRQYPEVIFLSISFDNKETMNAFLDKMMLFYPVGLDTKLETIRNYGVQLFPETFLIDQNGVIRWQGSSFQLEEKHLNKVLDYNKELRKLSVVHPEGTQKYPGFTFSIEENNLGMKSSSYHHSNPYDINIFNKNLQTILSDFFKVNKSRLICNDSSFIMKNYNIVLKADSTQAKEYESEEMIKHLIPNELDFRLIPITKDTLVHVLKIENKLLLDNHLSKKPYASSSSDYKFWNGNRKDLSELKKFMEDEYGILVELEQKTESFYDFKKLPMTDLEKLNNLLLKKYGIALKIEERKTTLFEIQSQASDE